VKNSTRTMIGVLDLQGGVVEHLDHLKRLGLAGLRVKKPSEISNLAGIIIPGGESTCLFRLLTISGMKEAIVREFQQGMKIFGTCAGAILLAKTVIGESPCLALIDIEVERNSFGSQMDSFFCEALVPRVSSMPVPLTFIRAPKIKKIGPGVDILLKIGNYIAAAESPDVLVTIFHPELAGSLAFHRYFAHKCGLKTIKEGRSMDDPTWNAKSWTQFARVAD